jgi:hypothetical protein
VAVIHPKQWQALLPAFDDASMFGAQGAEIIKTGAVGNLYGCLIFETANVTTATVSSSTVYAGAIMHPSAIALAQKGSLPMIETERDASLRATEIVATGVWARPNTAAARPRTAAAAPACISTRTPRTNRRCRAGRSLTTVPFAFSGAHHMLSKIQARLDKAKNEYLREVAAVDRELQGVVRVDPSHLKAAVAVQKAFGIDPETLELKANEQPESVDAEPKSKSKKK